MAADGDEPISDQEKVSVILYLFVFIRFKWVNWLCGNIKRKHWLNVVEVAVKTCKLVSPV